MLTIQSVDVGEYKATIAIVNDSPKDVTHYSVSIDDISKGGTKAHSGYDADSEPKTHAAVNLAQARSNRGEWSRTSTRLAQTRVNAEVTMAIYSDGTAQAYNKEGKRHSPRRYRDKG